MQKEAEAPVVPDGMLFDTNTLSMPVEVQIREQDFYQSCFTRKVNQNEGGVK